MENNNDVALLTSVFKLFLREIAEPLIPPTVQNKLTQIFRDWHPDIGQNEEFANLRKTMEVEMTPMELKVTRFIFEHLRKVAEEPKNMMTPRNVAVVFAPNILHRAAPAEGRRPASILSEAELNTGIIEGMIEQFTDIFPKENEQ